MAEKRRQDKIISKNGIFRLQVLITPAFFQTIEVFVAEKPSSDKVLRRVTEGPS